MTKNFTLLALTLFLLQACGSKDDRSSIQVTNPPPQTQEAVVTDANNRELDLSKLDEAQKESDEFVKNVNSLKSNNCEYGIRLNSVALKKDFALGDDNISVEYSPGFFQEWSLVDGFTKEDIINNTPILAEEDSEIFKVTKAEPFELTVYETSTFKLKNPFLYEVLLTQELTSEALNTLDYSELSAQNDLNYAEKGLLSIENENVNSSFDIFRNCSL